jgi:hypothetical protein
LLAMGISTIIYNQIYNPMLAIFTQPTSIYCFLFRTLYRNNEFME